MRIKEDSIELTATEYGKMLNTLRQGSGGPYMAQVEDECQFVDY